jgi:tRNA-2-methylthio-N6-dimethylallyladenosine synthase
MPDTVPEAVKQRRLAETITVQRRVNADINAGQVGRRERVLIEGPSKRSLQKGEAEWLGRTDTFRSVIVPAGPGIAPGTLVDVVIERANAATLFGRALHGAGA